MGYIRTKETEQLVRKLFQKKAKVRFEEIVDAAMQTDFRSVSYADEVAKRAGDVPNRIAQLELTLDVTLRIYLDHGLVYPLRWKAYLRQVLAVARHSKAEDCREIGVGSVNVPEFQSEEAVVAAVESIDEMNVTWFSHVQVFAGAVRRTLHGWTKPTPPWLDLERCIAEDPDWRACHWVLISSALPWEEADEARPVVWMAGKSLQNAPFIRGVDL